MVLSKYMETGAIPEPTAQLLKQKYDLHKTSEVEVASQRTQNKTGDRVPQHPLARIQNYLDRFRDITDREDPEARELGIDAIKRLLHGKYVIKSEKISDEYIKNTLLGNEAELLGYERGQLQDEGVRTLVLGSLQEKIHSPLATYTIPDELRKELTTMVIADQTSRMDQWIDYLTSDEARHSPSSLRYWAFVEMLKMGDYDPVRAEYNKRTESTVASFPELDQQALSLVFDEVTKKYNGVSSAIVFEEVEKREKFRELLQNENFSALYAFIQEHVRSLKLPTERLVVTDGGWETFPVGSDPKALTERLSGFQTKWCIAGEGYAQGYLQHSDIIIYFSKDADNKNTIPRACIVRNKQDGTISEVRGIISNADAKQHLDDYIAPMVEDKLQTLKGGNEWLGRLKDTKTLAKLHIKSLQDQPFNREDLIFLYQIDHRIWSSGYGQDPRIEELRLKRNLEADMLVIFGTDGKPCNPRQIARSLSDIVSDPSDPNHTVAYVGSLVSGIFDRLVQAGVEHIYTSFPEGNIRTKSIEIGGKAKDQLQAELVRTGVNISSSAQYVMSTSDFTTLPEAQMLNTVRVKVSSLGLYGPLTTDRIYERAQELGLELCPAETGPNYRLQYADQPLDEYFVIGMKQITDYNDYSNIFFLTRNANCLKLSVYPAGQDIEWDPWNEFVFSLRKP